MARSDGVANPELRTMFQRAQREMREGKAAESVHTSVAAFLKTCELCPAILAETIRVRGRDVRTLVQFPRLGANLRLESVEAGKPEIVFERERFATSEAITYYEFALDTALAHNE